MKQVMMVQLLKHVSAALGQLGDAVDSDDPEALQKRAKKRAKTESLFDRHLKQVKEAEAKFKQERKAQKKEAKARREQQEKAAKENAKARRKSNEAARSKAAQKELKRKQKQQAAHDARVARAACEEEAYRNKRAARISKRENARDASRLHPRNPAYLPASFVGAPAITLVPMADEVATGTEAIKLGGYPQLPAEIAWPQLYGRNLYHFYAQIDFASLPRRLCGGGYDFEMPTFPGSGTLFIFLPMADLALYEERPAVIYVKGSVAHLPERHPPEDTVKLEGEAASELWPNGVGEDRQSLRRQFASSLAFMSTRRASSDKVVPPADQIAAVLSAGLELTLNEQQINPQPSAAQSDWDRYVAQSTRVPPSEHAIDHEWRFCWDYRQIQMFGYGDNVQDAGERMEGKIMLLQVGDKFGTPLKLADVAIQLWISPEDLAAGRFDRLDFTQDCS